ncbi:hypothetical protein C2G38_2246125 [Gigaspora rosea]|uniref:G-protein coupled receptors family 1 profile domain-containing protein n=1 Tax=Gigaspora rosea TaxID=44941 RepID=A0A397V5M2_9GLOM|nr:hypothetical protein C2G38_2246125 [Gigaspora rosea]
MDNNYQNIPGLYVVLPTGISIAMIDLICTIYVIARSLNRWLVTKTNLSMAHRVPLYIALSDLILVSNNIINLSYTLINGHTLQGTSCKVIGGITYFALGCNIIIVGAMALVTYLRICRNHFVNLGKYDYKLFLSIMIFNIGFTIIVIPSLGPAKYWCISGQAPLISLLIVILNCTIFTITIFSYTMTLREINQRQKLIKQYSLATPNLSWLEIIATRKIIGYILTYLIQWTPVVIYVAGLMVDYDEVWTNIIAVATINFGGVANMIAYIVNEKWRDDYRSSLSSSYLTSSKPNTTSKSSTNNDNSLSQITVEGVITVEINQDPVFSSPVEKFFARVL